MGRVVRRLRRRGEETDDELFGDDGGEHVLHQFAFALHGGLHPVALAPEVDPALYAFQWDRLIANSVSHQLAEMGGHRGRVRGARGGDAEVDAAVDAFVRRVDSSGDGLLTVRDVEDELLREERAGNGWAAKALRDESGKSLDAHVVAERLVRAADDSGNNMVSARGDQRSPQQTRQGKGVTNERGREGKSDKESPPTYRHSLSVAPLRIVRDTESAVYVSTQS